MTTPDQPDRLICLPAEMIAAFESFQLQIIRQRLDRWEEVSRTDVLDAIGMLAEMVMQREEPRP